ncbi:hypothetical protein EJ06DRAFT_308874 [Trichodelitschia bisporula]|uniref:Multicopper oxidase n=1 Tax=Trichodelitschia bisporula TaxID=703511 RepID=A0A6G1I3K9_9PEZI|nr:hypothetical protein EJ06DRAFT_308874 [Trichodelitschia bisporula]
MLSLFLLQFFLASCFAKTVVYDMSIGWVNAAPDGFMRPVIGVNGQWPPPAMEVDLGDTVTVNIKNDLGNETTSLHYHGMIQLDSNAMDGVPMTCQCPIQPGQSYSHTFKAFPAGIFWYHSHDKGQYPDGLRAPMIVRDRKRDQELQYDKEYFFSVSDWFHDESPYILHDYFDGSGNFRNGLSKNRMPAPPSTLINDTTSLNFQLEPNKRYLFRMVSMAAVFPHVISFEDHDMYVVNTDGVPTQPTKAKAIEIHPGQRYEVIVIGKAKPTKNYALVSYMPDVNLQTTSVISYGVVKGSLRVAGHTVSRALILDDMQILPQDQAALYGPPDVQIDMPVSYFGKRHRRIRLGEHAYVTPKIPALFIALSTGEEAWNPAVYGTGINPHIVKQGSIVQIVVENMDDVVHPMHLHGYQFQTIARGPGKWNKAAAHVFPPVPMRRDTVTTPANGHLVIRFRANNPGVWMFHCHMEFHSVAGMMATIIEAPDILQKTVTISPESLDLCKAQNIPTSGNCAGLTDDLYDTSQCNTDFPPEEWGALINPPTKAAVAAARVTPVRAAPAPAKKAKKARPAGKRPAGAGRLGRLARYLQRD